jgi:hypothetical protein
MDGAWDTIGWWEAKRVPFNLIVGCAGIISGTAVLVVGTGSWIVFQSDFGIPDPPLFAVLAALIYAILANICYTGGWMCELLVRKLWPQQAGRFACLSFSLGLVFSVILTLTPGIVITSAGIFLLVRHFLR